MLSLLVMTNLPAFSRSGARDTLSAPALEQMMIGDSPALRDTLRAIATVAPTQSTVLVSGETGTGKELVARAVHERSARRGGPFVKVNCAAIPASLLESELFGHERGAFTGALQRRAGRFELAHGGTLFLDEIGELPIELQPKLLRVLQEREFERVGGTQSLVVETRIVAATNRDLAAMVEERTFRADLYYRLNVFPIEIAPLRARKDDVPLLARLFLRRFAAAMGKDVRELSPESLDRLVQHDWPGNVRELENVIERAVILAGGAVLEIPPNVFHRSVVSGGDDMQEVQRRHIVAMLEKTDGVVGGPNGAAQRLGMKRSTLNFRMKKLGIVRHG
jgi:transcriptional regulator with GAF, ATPase, and Fis domain